VKKVFDQNIKKYKAGVQIMNETSIVAKALVEKVRVLQPKVEKELKVAEAKSISAGEEEAKAKVIMDAQAEFKIKVEVSAAEADKILAEAKKEMKIAEDFKKKAEKKLNEIMEDKDFFGEIGT